MRRVHTTFDLLEAHIVTEMLRQHGVRAWLFDADFVRQNWLESIAFGGYRVMVSDTATGDARRVLKEYTNGTLALPDEQRAACPNCGQQQATEDPCPRRQVFLALIVLPWITAIALIAWKPSPMQMLFAFALHIGLYLCLPWLAIWYFKWPSRCGTCGHRWRDPRAQRHSELARMANVATAADG